jgi:hypothetical protein
MFAKLHGLIETMSAIALIYRSDMRPSAGATHPYGLLFHIANENSSIYNRSKEIGAL